MPSDTITTYMAAHPDAWDAIEKATLAYHIPHFRLRAGSHDFAGLQREAECRWCGRSREMVRWDDLLATCAARPASADQSIESVVAREEALFARVFERAKGVASTVDLATLDGAQLCHLHYTHGVDPSMLECALMEAGRGLIPTAIMDDYGREYAKHRATGAKGGVTKTVLIAKTLCQAPTPPPLVSP